MRDNCDCNSRTRIVTLTSAANWQLVATNNSRRVAIAFWANTQKGLGLRTDAGGAYTVGQSDLLPCSYPIWYYLERHGSIVQDPWYGASADAPSITVVEVISPCDLPISRTGKPQA